MASKKNDTSMPSVQMYTEDEKAKRVQQTLTMGSRPYGNFTNAVSCLVDVHILDIDDAYQRECKDNKLAKTWDPRMCSPLTLSYRDGHLWIVDGGNRVKAAKLRGIPYLPAFIHTDLTQEEECRLFAGQLKSIHPLKQSDTLKCNLFLGEPVDTLIDTVCGKYGIHITTSRGYKTMSALGAARKLVLAFDDLSEAEDFFNWMFNIMKASNWLEEKDSPAISYIMEAFCSVYKDGKAKCTLTEYTTRLISTLTLHDQVAVQKYANLYHPIKEKRTQYTRAMTDIATGVAAAPRFINAN